MERKSNWLVEVLEEAAERVEDKLGVTGAKEILQ